MIISPRAAPCGTCSRFTGVSQPDGTEASERWACAAFPEGIPQPILLGRNMHTQPYPGDHGFQYKQEGKP